MLSDYTFAVRASETDSTLLNVGKAYNGLTDVELAALTEQAAHRPVVSSTRFRSAHGVRIR